MDQIPAGGEGPHDPTLAAQVERLKRDVQDVRLILVRLEPMIVRIDTTIPHLATKKELADLRTELKTEVSSARIEVSDVETEIKSDIARISADLAEKPSQAYLWLVMAAPVAAYATGLAGLAALK